MTKSVPFRLVALVGLRGSGKTTLGRALAARLGWAFADGDDLLAAHTGRDAAKFLTEAGEPAFRAAERAVLLPFVAGAAQTVLGTNDRNGVPPSAHQSPTTHALSTSSRSLKSSAFASASRRW